MDSVTYTGTCRRPSCTAMVCPTMSGMIVERRDQVLMTFLSPLEFRTSTFFEQVVVDERALLQATRHVSSTPRLTPRAAGAAPTDDHRIGLLVAGPGAALGLAPRRHRVTATRGLALATAERVVDGVHGDATGLRALALPAVAAGLADLDQLGLGVADHAEGAPAVDRAPAAFRSRAAAGWRRHLPWPRAGRSCRRRGPSCRRRPGAARRCGWSSRPGCSAAAARCRAGCPRPGRSAACRRPSPRPGPGCSASRRRT